MSQEGQELFEYRYGSIVTELHILLKDECRGTNLYALPKSSMELMQFVQIFSNVTDQVFEEADEELPDSSDDEGEDEPTLPAFSM